MMVWTLLSVILFLTDSVLEIIVQGEDLRSSRKISLVHYH